MHADAGPTVRKTSCTLRGAVPLLPAIRSPTDQLSAADACFSGTRVSQKQTQFERTGKYLGSVGMGEEAQYVLYCGDLRRRCI
jgi:hypothetical protein